MKQTILWGILLWFIGYLLGIIAFMLVPPTLIGYVVMPMGILVTLWVLLKKSFSSYLYTAIIWTLIAVIFDYLFNVRLFHIVGYYKPDIYLYYALTFIMPLAVGKYRKAL